MKAKNMTILISCVVSLFTLDCLGMNHKRGKVQKNTLYNYFGRGTTSPVRIENRDENVQSEGNEFFSQPENTQNNGNVAFGWYSQGAEQNREPNLNEFNQIARMPIQELNHNGTEVRKKFCSVVKRFGGENYGGATCYVYGEVFGNPDIRKKDMSRKELSVNLWAENRVVNMCNDPGFDGDLNEVIKNVGQQAYAITQSDEYRNYSLFMGRVA